MEVGCPWGLGIVMLLVLLGTGRGLLWGLGLDRMRSASNVLVGLVLGMVLFHYVLFGLTRWGPLGPPVPWLLLGLGALLALPGLYRVGHDLRGGPLGWRGAGTPAGLVMGVLLLVTVLLSAVWLNGALGFEGLDVLLADGRHYFEGANGGGFEGANGGGLGDRHDPYLRDALWEGWGYGLGAPAAALVLFWGLMLGMLVGAGALGRNLHSRGAGLAAALLLALFLLVGNGPLRFETQLFGALALLAVVLLAVEGRRRPHLGLSLLAGVFAGYAWVADPLAWALLLPLALFGPSWCKSLDRGERVALDRGEDVGLLDQGALSLRAEYRYEREALRSETSDGEGLRVDVGYEYRYDEEDSGGYDDYGDAAWLGEGEKKKWGTPLRHGAVGLGGGLLGASPALSEDVACAPGPDTPLLRLGYDLDWPQVDFGASWLDTGAFSGYGIDPFWDFFVWGGLVGLLALGSLSVARHRRRSVLYLVPGVLWFGLAGTATGYEDPLLAGYPLLAGLGGMTLAEAWLCRELGCLPSGVGLGVPGALAVGGLGLSTAYDCGYWDEMDDWYGERGDAYYRDLRYDWDLGNDLRFDWDLGYDLRFDRDWGLGSPGDPLLTLPGGGLGSPGQEGEEEEDEIVIPYQRPVPPVFRPFIPDHGVQNPGKAGQQQQSPRIQVYPYPQQQRR